MKKIAIFILTVIISAFTCLFAGCMFSAVSNLLGTYSIDFSKSSKKVDKIIENGTITIKGTEAYVSIKYKNTYLADYRQSDLQSGNYKVEYSDCKSDFIGGSLSPEHGTDHLSFNVRQNYLHLYHVQFGKNESYDLYFLKLGAPADPSASRFNEIKSAYSAAGYNTDLYSDGNIDITAYNIMTTMKIQYGQSGYDYCFIGKNMNNPIYAEMYMLIGAIPEEVEAFAQEFEGKYKYKKKGSDIIVYIWTLGTPNFIPFDNAVN